MGDINELRTRAAALGYKTIHKRGAQYWLIDADGEQMYSADGLDRLADDLDRMEASDARLATETGIPDFDAMNDDEIALYQHSHGNLYMTHKQRNRAQQALKAKRKGARGTEIFKVPSRIPAKEGKLGHFDIEEIQISGARRPLNEDTVISLMKSIERIGLQTPPTIRRIKDVVIDGEEWDSAPYLVTGRHRLEAMRRLGHLSITCLVLDLDDVTAELTEIAENLHRAELTVLQRDEQIARWIELTSAKSEIPSDDAKPAQLAQVSGGRGNRGGISEASRELGIERTDAARAVKVAALSPEAKAAAIDVGLDDNRSALLEAANQTEPEKQVLVIRTRSQTRRATKDEREALQKSAEVTLEVAMREAEKRKAGMRADVDDDGYYLKDEPVNRWRRSLENMAGESISLPSFWTREFSDWTSFEATPEIVQLALDAALMWSNLAVDLKRRLAGNDQQQAA